jgi:response regulator RpfG family c-di-GMP phosphodiesterase
MAKAGPIVLIDDDPEEEELIREVLHQLSIKNKLIHFNDCNIAFDYLKNTADRPLIIISDVNLPKKTGIEFKRQIDEDSQLRSKSIPFVFFSTSIDKNSVDTIYKELSVQGYFQKTNSIRDLKTVIKLILDYWMLCRHPNS